MCSCMQTVSSMLHIYVYFILRTCVGETRRFAVGVGTMDQAFFIAAAQQSLLNVVSRWRLKRSREFKGRANVRSVGAPTSQKI